MTFTLGHTVGDASDGICSRGHTHCQAHNRPAGVIRTSNGECIKWLNCDGRQEDELHEYYQNFQCIEKGNFLKTIIHVFDFKENVFEK